MRRLLRNRSSLSPSLSTSPLRNAVGFKRAGGRYRSECLEGVSLVLHPDSLRGTADSCPAKAGGLQIDRISALKSHRVLTWEGAYLELGDEFERLFSPQSPQHSDYIEIAHQEEQVRRFWRDEDAVIVIDRSLFEHFSKAMGHSMREVGFHPIFPPITDFKAVFTIIPFATGSARVSPSYAVTGSMHGFSSFMMSS